MSRLLFSKLFFNPLIIIIIPSGDILNRSSRFHFSKGAVLHQINRRRIATKLHMQKTVLFFLTNLNELLQINSKINWTITYNEF